MSVDISGSVNATTGSTAVYNSTFWNSSPSTGILINGSDMKNNRLYPTADITICNISLLAANINNGDYAHTLDIYIKTPYATGTYPNLNLFTSIFVDQASQPSTFIHPEIISSDIKYKDVSGNINRYQAKLAITVKTNLPANTYMYVLSFYGSCYVSSVANDTTTVIKGESQTPSYALNYNIPTGSNIKGNVTNLGEIYPIIEQISQTTSTASFENGSFYGGTITLQRNYRNTTNYMPFVSVIANTSVQSTANEIAGSNISKPIIYNRTSTSFNYSYKFNRSAVTTSIVFYFMIIYY